MENEPKLSEINLKQLQNILLNAPAAIAVYEMPEYKYILANKAYEKLTNRKVSDLLGKSIRNVFPELNGTGTFELFDTIFINGESFTDPEYPVIVDIKNDGVLKQCYFNFSMEPLKNDLGEVYAMVATTCDITEQVEARKKIEDTDKQFKNVLLQSANIFVILEGFPEMIITFANEPLFKSWGKTASIIGKPLLEVLPEIECQPFPKLLQQVFETGKTYNSKEEKAVIIKNGAPVDTYFVYVYQPIFNDAHKVTGVTVMATDITEQVIARKASEESEYLYNEMIYSSPFMISILKGENMIIEIANDTILSSWGKEKEVIGKSIFDVIPEVIEQGFDKLLLNVYRTGEPFLANETPVTFLRNGVNKIIYYNFVYQAHRNIDGAIVGVAILANEVTSSVELNNKRKENEKQKTFLLNFSDKLRAEPTVNAVANSALQMLSEHLKLDRCYIGVYQLAEDRGVFPYQVGNERVPPMPASVRLSDFPDALRVAFDQTLVIDDVTKAEGLADTDRQNLGALGLCALVAVTLRHGENNPLWSIVSVSASPRRWTSSEIKLIEEVTERTWAAVETAKAEEALRKSEEKYRTLFTSIDQGLVLCELVRDKEGKGIDYYMLELNPTYESQTGISQEMVLGKTILQVFPTIEKGHIDTFAAVVDNQCPVIFEQYFEVNNRWHEVKVYPGEKDKFTVLFSNITERKQAENKIKESEQEVRKIKEQLELSIQAGKIGIWHWDVKKDLLYWSKEQNDIYGISDSIKITCSSQFNALIFPEDLKRIQDEQNEGTNPEHEYDFRIARKNDGAIRWIKSRARNVLDSQGVLQSISGVNIDVTDQVLALNKIQESEEKFKRLVLQAPVAICVLRGKDYMIELMNDGMCALWDRTLVQALNKPVFDVIPEVRDQGIKELLDSVYFTGESCVVEELSVNIMRKGTLENAFVKFVYEPIREADGTVSGIMALAHEITEQVIARKKVEESEKKFEAAILAVAGIIWTNNAKGEMTGDQPGWAKLTGQSYEEYQGYGWTKAIHPDDAQPTIDAWNQAVATNSTFEFEHRVRTAQNEYRLFSVKAVPAFDENKAIQQWVSVHTDITEQKIAQEKLAYRTALLEAHNEASIDGVLLVDTKGKILSCNQRFVELLNMPQQIVNDNDDEACLLFAMSQLVYPEQFIEKVKYLYDHPNETSFDELEMKNGKIIERNGYSVFGEDGTYYARSWTFKDITERKRIEQDLKNTKEQLELTFKNIPAGVYLINAKGEMVYVNDKGASVYGDFTPEYMLKHNDLTTQLKIADELFERFDENGNYFSAQDSPAFISLTTGKSSQAILKQIHKISRQQRWYYVQGAPLFDEKGNVSLVLITSTDITEQKNAEEKIKHSEERFRSLAETLPQMVWVLNATGEMEYASKNWKHYSGIDDVTEAWNYMTHPDDREHLTAHWNKVLAEKKGYKHEVRLKNKEGVYHWFYSVGEPVMDVHGKIIKWVGSLTDTQEQKEVAEKLMQAKVSAENAAKSRQQFLSNMSHEIRTPLNSIIGFTNVLNKTELDEKQKEFVEAIKTSGRSLNLLINDILDLAKVDAGKMTFEKEPFEIQKSINAALHSFDLKIQEKNLELIKNYDSKIPTILLGDSVRLNQIILNLTSNAIKFTHQGKITINITLLNEDNDTVNIEFVVTDTGIGIAASKIKSVFNVFEQSENSTFNSYGGTGLGLAIVKQLIEEQGGTINLISKLGLGSTFTFMMPFGKTTLKTQQKIEFPTVYSEIKNLRILVAEDVALNQMLIKIILNDFGFEYEIVDNGKLAIEKMQTDTYDIILMDLQMPEMNGFEATEYIRKTLKSAIPIIALTADVTTVDVIKCQKFGMDGYISKPINENLLYSKIVELVQNKH